MLPDDFLKSPLYPSFLTSCFSKLRAFDYISLCIFQNGISSCFRNVKSMSSICCYTFIFACAELHIKIRILMLSLRLGTSGSETSLCIHVSYKSSSFPTNVNHNEKWENKNVKNMYLAVLYIGNAAGVLAWWMQGWMYKRENGRKLVMSVLIQNHKYANTEPWVH